MAALIALRSVRLLNTATAPMVAEWKEVLPVLDREYKTEKPGVYRDLVVEMIHTATLVHDDVLDEAELRRHVPTVNAGWGNKVSILLGDMLFTHAFHLTSTVDGRACQIIGEATNRVCAGELRQVSERGNLNLTETDYFAIVEGKTAALTECCGRLGALYSGASDEIANKLASFGRNLGLAFQIADDLLDLTGNEDTVGKTLGTDLEQRQ